MFFVTIKIMNKLTKTTLMAMVCAILLVCQSARAQRCRPGSMVCELGRSFIPKQVKSLKSLLFFILLKFLFKLDTPNHWIWFVPILNWSGWKVLIDTVVKHSGFFLPQRRAFLEEISWLLTIVNWEEQPAVKAA